MFYKIIDVNIFRWRLAVTAQARTSGRKRGATAWKESGQADGKEGEK